MSELVLSAALVVAFANGANDNMKGVATLYGSGALSYRKALALATLSTALGSLASLTVGAALVAAFSGKGLVPDALLEPALLAAVACAAAATVLLATRLGFPISTTHALVGGLVGAGLVAAGAELNFGALGAAFVLPLLAGPALAVTLAFAGLRAGESSVRRLGARTITGGHLLSATMVGFARGLNDTPKILGLVVGASVLTPVVGTLAIATAMALGGLVAARRVAETLAKKITPMTPEQGLAGNVATSLLVIGASRYGLPVSTTHVSTGSIVGVGAAGGRLRWRAAGEILAAWVTTLPLAALLGAGAMCVLR